MSMTPKLWTVVRFLPPGDNKNKQIAPRGVIFVQKRSVNDFVEVVYGNFKKPVKNSDIASMKAK